VAVISPNQEYYLAAYMSGLGQAYGPVSRVANDVVEQFHKGTYAGVDFYISPYISLATATSIYSIGGMFAKNHTIGLLTPQPLHYFIEEKARGRGWDIVTSFWYGARRRVATHGAKLNTYAVTPS
jgi:hypothetical protein